MANKKVIISESMMKRLVLENIINENSVSDIINSRDFEKKIKDTIKNDKDFEKEVKKIIADALSEVFKNFWQRKDFWQGMVK